VLGSVFLVVGHAANGSEGKSLATPKSGDEIVPLFPVETSGSANSRVRPKNAEGEQAAYVKENMPRLKVGYLMQVSVIVSGIKEIDEPDKRISNKGELNLPLIGSVQVDGLTLDEVSQKLAGFYKQYFINPQVVVEFGKSQNSELVCPWGYVTVLGRVKKPGRVNIPPTQNLTVSGAIQQAGGLDTSAKDTAIKVTRQSADNQPKQFEINLPAIGSKGHIEEDRALQSGDIVFVPELVF